MSSELKPCPYCDHCSPLVDAHFDDSSVKCQNCNMEGPTGTYGECQRAWNSLPRKIKLTKELPSEAGYYYWVSEWVSEREEFPCIGEIDLQGDFYLEGRYSRPMELGGYWAKVDQSMFEVCDG